MFPLSVWLPVVVVFAAVIIRLAFAHSHTSIADVILATEEKEMERDFTMVEP
jgi:hypothetical protein